MSPDELFLFLEKGNFKLLNTVFFSTFLEALRSQKNASIEVFLNDALSNQNENSEKIEKPPHELKTYSYASRHADRANNVAILEKNNEILGKGNFSTVFCVALTISVHKVFPLIVFKLRSNEQTKRKRITFELAKEEKAVERKIENIGFAQKKKQQLLCLNTRNQVNDTYKSASLFYEQSEAINTLFTHEGHYFKRPSNLESELTFFLSKFIPGETWSTFFTGNLIGGSYKELNNSSTELYLQKDKKSFEDVVLINNMQELSQSFCIRKWDSTFEVHYCFDGFGVALRFINKETKKPSLWCFSPECFGSLQNLNLRDKQRILPYMTMNIIASLQQSSKKQEENEEGEYFHNIPIQKRMHFLLGVILSFLKRTAEVLGNSSNKTFHHDLKPENIVLDVDRFKKEGKISTDFIDRTSIGKISNYLSKGTALYFPPSLVDFNDTKTQHLIKMLYAMGITFTELLLGLAIFAFASSFEVSAKDNDVADKHDGAKPAILKTKHYLNFTNVEEYRNFLQIFVQDLRTISRLLSDFLPYIFLPAIFYENVDLLKNTIYASFLDVKDKFLFIFETKEGIEIHFSGIKKWTCKIANERLEKAGIVLKKLSSIEILMEYCYQLNQLFLETFSKEQNADLSLEAEIKQFHFCQQLVQWLYRFILPCMPKVNSRVLVPFFKPINSENSPNASDFYEAFKTHEAPLEELVAILKRGLPEDELNKIKAYFTPEEVETIFKKASKENTRNSSCSWDCTYI